LQTDAILQTTTTTTDRPTDGATFAFPSVG
jgi:hypothetical protein